MIERIPVLRTRTLALFYKELSSLISSGISVIDGMNIIADHPGSSRLKQIALKIREDLTRGIPLGEAFSKYPQVFPEWQVNVINYSEKSGRISQGFETLSASLERDYETQLSIVGGLAYPVALFHLAIFLLPLVNLFTCGGITKYLSSIFMSLVPLYGLIFFSYLIFQTLNSSEFSPGLHAFLLGIPIIGNLLKKISVSRFMLALYLLNSSGVPIIASWKIAAKATANEVIKVRMLSVLPIIEQGGQLSEALLQAGVCEASMVGLIRSAEKSGSLVQALESVYKYSDKEINAIVQVIARIVPVIIYIAVASFIALRVISFYLGYFNNIFTF